MPAGNALVYSITNGTFNRMDGIAIIDATNLSGNTRAENMALLVTSHGIPPYYRLRLYPSCDDYTGRVTRGIKTKRYSIAGANGSLAMFVLRRIKIDHGGDVQAEISVYNERASTSPITSGLIAYPQSGRWVGLPRNLKGFYFEMKIMEGRVIRDIEIDLIVYGK